MSPYKEFTARLKLLISKNPHLITTTLSNIFTMRLIGNKTHGDLAEIAILPHTSTTGLLALTTNSICKCPASSHVWKLIPFIVEIF